MVSSTTIVVSCVSDALTEATTILPASAPSVFSPGTSTASILGRIKGDRMHLPVAFGVQCYEFLARAVARATAIVGACARA